MNQYQEKGFESRKKYLENLAQQYNMETNEVISLAKLLGEKQDFDALINVLDTL